MPGRKRPNEIVAASLKTVANSFRFAPYKRGSLGVTLPGLFAPCRIANEIGLSFLSEYLFDKSPWGLLFFIFFSPAHVGRRCGKKPGKFTTPLWCRFERRRLNRWPPWCLSLLFCLSGFKGLRNFRGPPFCSAAGPFHDASREWAATSFEFAIASKVCRWKGSGETKVKKFCLLSSLLSSPPPPHHHHHLLLPLDICILDPVSKLCPRVTQRCSPGTLGPLGISSSSSSYAFIYKLFPPSVPFYSIPVFFPLNIDILL